MWARVRLAGLELHRVVALELPTKLQDAFELAVANGTKDVCSKPSTIFWRLSGVPMRLMSSESASEQNLRAGSEKVVNPVTRELGLEVHLQDDLPQDQLQHTIHVHITPDLLLWVSDATGRIR